MRQSRSAQLEVTHEDALIESLSATQQSLHGTACTACTACTAAVPPTSPPLCLIVPRVGVTLVVALRPQWPQ